MTSVNSAISFAEDDFTADKLAKCITKFLSSPKKAEAMAAAALNRSCENSVKMLSDLYLTGTRKERSIDTSAKPLKKNLVMNVSTKFP